MTQQNNPYEYPIDSIEINGARYDGVVLIDRVTAEARVIVRQETPGLSETVIDGILQGVAIIDDADVDADVYDEFASRACEILSDYETGVAV